MAPDQRRLDAIREHGSELENHYIDELVAGRLSRRDFIRRGSVVGLSAGMMGTILAACGSANSTGNSNGGSSSTTASGPVTKGGTLKVASQVPAAAINPITIADSGGLTQLSQTGEFLMLDNQGTLQPMLATSWKASDGGKTWTVKLRQGVKFSNGAPMTADDVVYTLKQQCDPKNSPNALSTFVNVLVPDGVHKVDDSTVAFHLEAADGNFPYAISNDNYNLIIVPNNTDFDKWQKTYIGTGPFVLKSYTQNQGSTFGVNPHWWQGKPYLNGTAFTFFASEQPQIVALQGGSVDVITQFVAQGAQAILSDSKYNIAKLQTSLHRELSMRCDQKPFDDPRVRQAIALCLDRPAMVKALLDSLGQVGNDSPFAPVFKSTNTSVPQRTQDLSKAKQLLTAAGHPHGFSATLFTEQYEEIPQLAQVIKQYASKIGVNINLKVETQDAYYGKATYGNSDWLDGEMSLVDYTNRGVPNLFLEATLTSNGPWNAAHYRSKEYDNLVKSYIATPDLSTQRTLAGKIERLLLADTPLVIPYFFDALTATTTSVRGAQPTALAQLFLGKASLTT